MQNHQITVLGIGFIFFMTTLGAALVFCFKKEIPLALHTALIGFVAGIMTAASIWSLLLPALSEAETTWGRLASIPVVFGLLLGGLFLALLDAIVAALKRRKCQKDVGGKNVVQQRALRKSTKLFLAVTLHNIPEGLAVGFAFGAAYAIGTRAAFLIALALAFGIGIQNFPEGVAVALPIKTEQGSRGKAFLYGALSGAVEPVFAVVGLFLATYLRQLQPWLLAFAAGAMLLVVAEDLLPEFGEGSDRAKKVGAWSMIFGFAMMMTLDVMLG